MPEQISCLLKTFEPGRQLDDYGTAAIRYANGALGTVTASQISHGRENDIFIEIDGTKGALEWHQEEPNKLFVRNNGEPHKLYTRAGGPYLGKLAARIDPPAQRPPGGFFEAFANIYTAAYDDMIKRAGGQKLEPRDTIYPERLRRRGRHELHHAVRGIQQGRRTMAQPEARGLPCVKRWRQIKGVRSH